jgi:peptidoglycan/xylan/chitin deacetylase (PgdA/CDA1 family)
VRALARRAAALVAAGAQRTGALDALERALAAGEDRLRVLAYHRVDEPGAQPDLHPGLLSATPADFERQMRSLARRWCVVSLGEVLRARRGARLQARAVLLTFDDAYRDFGTRAWPILARLGLPATLFVPTGYPDRPEREFWWDRLYRALRGSRLSRLDTPVGPLALATPGRRLRAFRRLRTFLKSLPHQKAMDLVEELCRQLGDSPPANRVLGWAELRRLAAAGVSLAAHTRTHPLLHRLEPAQVRDEALGALADLRREVGDAPPVLAYPSGGHDARARAVLREAGFELAFTTRPGVYDPRESDPLRIPRLCVGARHNPALLRVSLLAPRRAPPREPLASGPGVRSGKPAFSPGCDGTRAGTPVP